MVVNRLIGAYLGLVALVVGIQFVAFPLYGYDSGGERSSGALGVWQVLDWFMAIGLALMLVTTTRRKRRHEGEDSTNMRPWLSARVMFYGTILLTLAFLPNWFEAAWGHNDNWTIWHLIDTVLPVMFAVEGHRLWYAASS
ncbi:hypothetical protein [Candidatus Spongiisocius sp.]|uniref:hypothetical protein n=1 Tax=Candidatus Spongiisocius sp. TaxID=3101273 RepID=UPI003B5939A4